MALGWRWRRIPARAVGEGHRGGALEHEGAMEDRFEALGRRRAHRDVAPHGGVCKRRGTSGGSVDHRLPAVKEWSRRIKLLTRTPRVCRLDQMKAGGARRQ
jgi:hypothetical protein